MSKQARIIEKSIDKRTNRVVIREGEKGKGAEIWAHQYWTDSAPSADAMYSALQAEIESLEADGYTVAWA